jgi:regulator of replication initiation timing
MSQWVYSSAQVAQILGVSGGMVRRYALTLEELTGEKVPQHPRDGRRFSQEHVDALIAARRYVASHKGMSVEEGLRRALGMADESSAAPLPRSLPSTSLDTAEAFSEALRRYVEPLLTELQALRTSNERLADEVEALRLEVGELRALPGAEVGRFSSAEVVEPQRAEQSEWVEEVSRHEAGLGVRRPTDGGDEDGVLVRLARRLERLIGWGRLG